MLRWRGCGADSVTPAGINEGRKRARESLILARKGRATRFKTPDALARRPTCAAADRLGMGSTKDTKGHGGAHRWQCRKMPGRHIWPIFLPAIFLPSSAWCPSRIIWNGHVALVRLQHPAARCNLAEELTYPAEQQRRWSAYVHQEPDEEELAAIRRSSETGLPYGGHGWVDRLCRQLKLDLTIRPRGRQCKTIEHDK